MKSETTDKINITLTENTGELIIRHGEAEPIREPLVMSVTGTIDSIRNYIDVRGCNPAQGLVVYSYKDMNIQYKEHATNPLGATVAGKITLNPDLEAFGINTRKTYQPKELAQFLKMNRAHFADKESNAIIVKELSTLSARINTEIDKSQDTRGNSNNAVAKKVETNVPLDFVLQVPIFIGAEPSKFKVEICVDATDSNVTVWFESVELAELSTDIVKSKVDTELQYLRDKGLVVIQK